MTAAPLTALPRGPHSLGRDAVRESQRRRMLHAVTDAVAEKGFGDMVVADVVARAGVSRKTFYEHFQDRHDCFMAAYEDGLEALRSVMSEAVSASSNDPDPVVWLRASISSYLGFLAERPALARTFVLEVLAAGPVALARRTAAYDEFGAVTRAWHERARVVRPQYPAVPEQIYLAVVGAGHGLVADEVRRGRAHRLTEMEPLLMHVHLALLADARTVARSRAGTAQR